MVTGAAETVEALTGLAECVGLKGAQLEVLVLESHRKGHTSLHHQHQQ
jgi:hypothetical protein